MCFRDKMHVLGFEKKAQKNEMKFKKSNHLRAK